jgi:hypothetical protein
VTSLCVCVSVCVCVCARLGCDMLAVSVLVYIPREDGRDVFVCLTALV